MKLTRTWSLMVICVLVAVLALTGCSGSQPPAKPAEAPKAPAQKIYHRAFSYGADPATLDPMMTTTIDQQTALMEIFDTLVRYDPEKKAVVPRIAEKWDVSADGKTYTFYLRKGVKFHNGREVEAKDIKYTIERCLLPASAAPAAASLKFVVGAADMLAGKAKECSGLTCPDKYTIKMQLTELNTTWLLRMGALNVSIVPQEVVEKLGADFARQPVGCGPFSFVSWKKDDSVVLKAFNDYYAGRPKLDGIQYRVLPEANTKEAEFLAGNLDHFVLSGAQYKKYAADPKWKDNIVEVPELFTRYIAFNTSKAPFNKKQVRQAFCYAIDADALIKSVLMNKAFKAAGPLPSSIAGFNPSLKGYTYDVEKAKQLLKAAGYPNGITAEIMCTDNGSWGLPVVEAILPYLEKAGIKLKPQLLDMGTLVERYRQHKYDCFIMSSGGNPHPAQLLWGWFQSQPEVGGNSTLYKNPQVDKLLDQALKTQDWDQMVKIVQEAEKIVVDDAPWWFFNYNKAAVLRQPWVKGLIQNPTDIDLQFMEKVEITK